MTRQNPKFRVDKIAEEQGLNIHQLSQIARVSYSSVHKVWNNEARDVTVSTLNKLAEALGVNLTNLFDEGKEKEEEVVVANKNTPLLLAAA